MPYLLALDQGTTSSRAILFDHIGQVITISQREYQQHFPQPGWVEHDPEEIWTTQLGVAEQALQTANLKPSDISAIGITNQRETAVAWDTKSGKPLCRAIVWQDRRTAARCDRLRSDGYEQTILQKTGLLVDPYFSGTKFSWMIENVPAVRAAMENSTLAFGTIDSWLVFCLTGGATHVTDASNASRTQLMNIRTCNWDEQLLDIFQIPLETLPEICSSSNIYAQVHSSLPLAGIDIAGIAGDQQAALFGQTCFQSGQAKNTYGTGCFMLMNTAQAVVESQNKLLSSIAWRIDDETVYMLEGSVFTGGAVVGWLRDGLGIIDASSDVEQLANEVQSSGGVYLVPAFSGLGCPYWDPYARGTIVGITQGTSAAHIARAALEGIALQVSDLLWAMRADSDEELSELRVDGGAAVNDTLMQMQADLLQIPVIRPQVTETTALGAAYLAGLATGVWSGKEVIAEQWSVDQVFEPSMSPDEAEKKRTDWQRAVSRASGWAEGS